MVGGSKGELGWRDGISGEQRLWQVSRAAGGVAGMAAGVTAGVRADKNEVARYVLCSGRHEGILGDRDGKRDDRNGEQVWQEWCQGIIHKSQHSMR